MRCDSDPGFEEYIGQEVLCVEEEFDLRGVKFTEVSLAEKDTTIADFILKHAAKTVDLGNIQNILMALETIHERLLRIEE